jgi:UDP-perosamine 4-acetyltransferase
VVQVIGIGAGGHAKVVIEALRLIGGYEIVGLLDPKEELWGTDVMGVTVLGNDELLPELYSQGVQHAFIGLGSIGYTNPRRRLYELALGHEFQIVQAIHPQSVVSPYTQIGPGPTIMAAAVINAGAALGENVIVNTGAIVEHDCVIGNHVHIATGARLCSTVLVEAQAHIGAGATVRQCTSIGEGAVVGAGAVVVKNVEPWTVVAGVPATILNLATHESHNLRKRAL